MKSKKLLFVLPFLAVSAMLTSCAGNPYKGNYTEVTDKEAVTEKLNSLAEAEEETKTGYETLLNGSISMSYGSSEDTSYKVSCGFTSNGIVDNSGDSSALYQKLSIDAKLEGVQKGTVKLSAEMWIMETSYLNYSYEAKSDNGNVSYNGKVKGDNASSSLPLDVSSYLGMIEGKDEIDLDALNSILSTEEVKIYADGENKYKFEYEEGTAKVTMYLLINKDNTYQILAEVPELKTSVLGMMDMTMSYTVEVKPTSKKVTAPADADSYEQK